MKVQMMDPAESTVFIVDDEPAIRKSLALLIQSVGLAAQAFGSADEFLASYDPRRPGCLILDVRMPRMSGLELQRALADRQVQIPIIIITGHGDMSVAVRGMRMGAVDVMEKPFNHQVLLDRVQEAIALDRKQREMRTQHESVRERLARLTPREREVMDLIVAGKSNKEAAAALGVSPKTVEVHRAHVMDKLQVSALAEMVEMVTRVRLADVSVNSPSR
jgi:RNA polymerase sigma factor (sigma-70 family)